MADFGGAELEAFRGEVKAWLEANYPPELKAPRPTTDPEAIWGGRRFANSDDPHIVWMRRVAEKGWTAPTWPKEYGGAGLSPAQARVVEQELQRGGYRQPLASFGIWMLGPVLLEYGNEEQKKEHLPKIVRGEIRWCQGYSEPGAGSDLASLQTRCEDKGDHWLINGQKIWTSYADKADWCFCLVRTDTSKKHEGISFVLIDMHQPGVEARPIKLIAGNSPFCETFFTNARVEKNDMVGPLNGGWTVGKRLLQHERSGQSGGRMMGGAASVADIAKNYVGVDEKGRIADLDLRTRIAAHMIDAKAHSLTLARAVAEAKGNLNPTATTSVMKNSGTQIGQQRSELLLEIMGHQGLGWDGDDFTKEELQTVRQWLSGKATTIFGGSQEIQNNIITKRILGLPEMTQKQ